MAAYETVDLIARVRFPRTLRKFDQNALLVRAREATKQLFADANRGNTLLSLSQCRAVNAYGGNSVMAAYETVDLMARVRFPLTALKLNELCKVQNRVLRTERRKTLNAKMSKIRVLRTESQAALLLAIIYSGLLFRLWNSNCAKGTQIFSFNRTKDIFTRNIYKQKLMEVLIWN